jgi:aromatic-L-amino-acid decarboxylase
MNWDEYARWGKEISDWGADYHKTIRDRPVRAQVAPGKIAALLGDTPPEDGEDMSQIMQDFERVVMPGITHWQHPRFFAYFPSNASPPAILADYLTSTMAVNSLLWQTSPAATEMETRMMDWLRQAIGLPEGFAGVIQDSASSATLAAVLTMRERALNWQGNSKGLSGMPRLRLYCSSDVHSSIDRAIWVAGLGDENLVRLQVDGPLRSVKPQAMRAAIERDIADGYRPAGIIASTGATGAGSCDNIQDIIAIAKEFDLYLHVDAAWAGSAMICPEFRSLWHGVEGADSIVFNPHKWLGVQFDCSAHFLKNPETLVRTLAIQPEYLKTHGQDGLINYSEWSIALGRRFRALKLWFLLRSYGLEQLRTRIRNHIKWSHIMAESLRDTEGFEIVTEPILSLFTFRYAPAGISDLDALNQNLVDNINDDGRIYITQTSIDGQKVIRFQVGQFDCTEDDITFAYDVICDMAHKIGAAHG